MANKLYEEADISNIATAIRSKSNSTSNYKVSEMADAISNISSGDDNAFWVGNKLGVNCTLPSNITTMSNSYTQSNQYSIKIYYKSNNVTTLASNALSNSGTVGFDFPNLVTISNGACENCPVLSYPVTLPQKVTMGYRAFSNCKLTKIDFNQGFIDKGGSSQFVNNTTLKTVIIRGNEVSAMQLSGMMSSVITFGGYIYVPSSMVDEYKAATNWTKISDYIRAIEDYPEITGGES